MTRSVLEDTKDGLGCPAVLALRDVFDFPNLKKSVGGRKLGWNDEIIAGSVAYSGDLCKLYWRGLKKEKETKKDATGATFTTCNALNSSKYYGATTRT